MRYMLHIRILLCVIVIYVTCNMGNVICDMGYVVCDMYMYMYMYIPQKQHAWGLQSVRQRRGDLVSEEEPGKNFTYRSSTRLSTRPRFLT